MTKPPEVINEKFVQQKVKLYPQNTNRLLNCIQLKIEQKYKNIKCSYFSGWMLWWVSTTFFKSSTRPSTTSSTTFIVTIRQVIWSFVSWNGKIDAWSKTISWLNRLIKKIGYLIANHLMEEVVRQDSIKWATKMKSRLKLDQKTDFQSNKIWSNGHND